MEIEAKFRIAAADLPLVATLTSLGAYTLRAAPAVEQQINTYYDTPDERLTTARYGLRVRQIGPQSLVTLKGPAEVGDDGVHRRAEYEFPGSDPRPITWPPGVARDLALALTGGASLQPTVIIATERQIRYVERDGLALAELCLDRGVMRVADREHTFTELEVELLKAGRPADLHSIVAALAERVRISPESHSKLQRALQLRRQALA
ncbi:MAG: inorganic triphosphatase [Oscillochloridaceae bacterium umkhey_bin13]